MSPVIPEYQKTAGLIDKAPAVEVDTRSYGREALAQSALWGQVAKSADKLADVGFDIKEKMTRAKMSDDFSNMVVKYNTDYYALRDSIKDKPPEQRADLFKEGSQKLMEDTLNMSQFPGVQTAFKRHWAMHFPAQNQSVIADARRDQIANFHGNKDVNLDKLAEMAGSEDNPTIRTQRRNEAYRMLEEGVLNNLIQPHQMEVDLKKFDANVSRTVFDRNNQADPFGTQKALKHKDAFGLDDKTRIEWAMPHNQQAIGKAQTQLYDQLFGQIVQNAGESGGKGPIPTEEQVKGLLKGDRLHAGQANNLLGYIEGAKHNPENKDDPNSYKEVVTRLTDPESPLTREEFINNVKSGTWKVSANTYGHFLTNIHNRDLNKIPKQLDAAFGNRTKSWAFQFRGGAVTGKESEEYKTGMAMVYQSKIAGDYDGMTPDQVQQEIDTVFKTQINEYQRRYHLDPATMKRVRQPVNNTSWYKPWTWSGQQQPARTQQVPGGGSGERPWTQGNTGIRDEGGWR